MVQRLLCSLAADKDPPRFDMAADIVADFLSRLELEVFTARVVLNMGFPASVESFKTGLQPRDAGFHKADAEIRIFVEYAVEDNAGERDHLAERMAQTVDRRVRRKIVHPQAFMGTTVNADAAA